MKLFQAALLTGLFILLLLSTYVLHMRFFSVNVVFYSALVDAFIAMTLTSLVAYVLRFKLQVSGFEKLLLCMVWILGGYAFAISIPTVLDRSLSFYILEKLQQRGGGILEDSIDDVFVKEYLPEFRLVDVRLTEQLESGTIIIKNGCVILTPSGQRLAKFSRFFRLNLLPKKRLLAGEYTDALVDPFAYSIKGEMGYECGSDLPELSERP